MNRQKPFRLLGSLMLVMICLNACSASTSTAIPTLPPPPSFDGRLILESGEILYELSNVSTTATAASLQMATDVTRANVSPDDRYLLYSTHDATLLRDLQTEEVKTLFLARAECFRWAADSTKFNYASAFPDDYGLYVYDLSSGKSTTIYIAPSAEYAQDGLAELGLGGREIHPDVFCGTWIGTDRIVFQRYKGSMPPRITEPWYPELRTNVTTLAQ